MRESPLVLQTAAELVITGDAEALQLSYGPWGFPLVHQVHASLSRSPLAACRAEGNGQALVRGPGGLVHTLSEEGIIASNQRNRGGPLSASMCRGAGGTVFCVCSQVHHWVMRDSGERWWKATAWLEHTELSNHLQDTQLLQGGV